MPVFCSDSDSDSDCSPEFCLKGTVYLLFFSFSTLLYFSFFITMTVDNPSTYPTPPNSNSIDENVVVEETNNDVLSLDENTFDIYIRMKKSFENDFCFQVNNDTTFKDLLKIFEKVPIIFSPSIFYDKVPISFKISHFPGILTRTGTILFETKADNEKYLKSINNLNDKVSDYVLPGQLIIPVFNERSFLHYSVISFIFVWLYTDLPDFISPTPGICLTNYATDLIVYLLREVLERPAQADSFYSDIHAPVGIFGQCIYFAFHIFKVSLFYFILWAGLFNPYSWRKPRLALSREDLIELGWTGVKKASKQQYQDDYRKNAIAEYGSIMNLYKAGKLSYIKHCFIDLQKGEGYDQLNKIDKEIIPFKLNKQLLLKERELLNEKLIKLPYIEAYNYLKNYRKSGSMTPSPIFKSIIDLKFAPMDEEILGNERKINPITTGLNESSSSSVKTLNTDTTTESNEK